MEETKLTPKQIEALKTDVLGSLLTFGIADSIGDLATRMGKRRGDIADIVKNLVREGKVAHNQFMVGKV